MEIVSDTALAERPTDTPEVETRSSRADGKGRRLTHREVSTILQLAEIGKNIPEIAQVVDCSVSTVHSTLEKYADNRSLARRKLEGGATKLVDTVLQTKDAATALRALGKLDVVRDEQDRGGTNIAIVIGQPGQALQPPSIQIASGTEIRPLSPTNISDLACGKHG